MEQKKKEEKKQRTTTSSFNPAAGKSDPIYYSTNRMDGTGLWVQPTSKRIPEPSLPQAPVVELTHDVENKVAKDMVKMLEQKCSTLGRQIDEAHIQTKTDENKLHLLEGRLNTALKEKSDVQKELDGVQGKKAAMEQEMDEFTIFRNYMDSQVCSLQKEVDNEKERAEAYRNMYEQETKNKEDETAEYDQEIQNLNQQMSGLSEQNSQLFEFIKKKKHIK